MHHTHHSRHDMANECKKQWAEHHTPAQRMIKHLTVGLFLLGFGAIAFLNQQGVLHVTELWHYAPLIMVVFGLAKMFVAPTPSRFARGVFLVFLGLWVTASLVGFAGLTFANSWPLVLIAVGIRMLLEAVLRFAAKKE
ncbi:MAG: hypothetical protein HYZ45_06340 [Burkholderiales bacterium]|nr:hypothetical protein [Burkholderiales bacterium]